MAAVDAISSMWPSGVALATCSVPIRPLAPGRFSITIVCPHIALSLGASVRASVSAPPAGGNGTTMVTVRLGNAWAEAKPTAPGSSAPHSRATIERRAIERGRDMAGSAPKRSKRVTRQARYRAAARPGSRRGRRLARWRCDDRRAQRRETLDAALDDVARLEEQHRRVRLADRDAARRAGREHVAGLDRDVAREVLDDVGQLPDLVARVDAHAQLAVDRAGHPQVVRIGDLVERDQLGPERAEARDVLAGPEARARLHLALLRIAVGEVVEDRHPGDVVEGLGLLDAERAPADHEHQLGLVVEADDALGPDDLGAVADQARVEL